MQMLDNVYKNKFIQSPLNFTGGKYKLLPQLLNYFPKNIDIFLDLFCGGANVGVNITSDLIILNDIDKNLIELLNIFKNAEKDIFRELDSIIESYGLSQTNEYGYKFYNCSSDKGLSQYNKEGFLKLRGDFNKLCKKDNQYYYMLYILVIYSFNNQIRFNSNKHYNLPVGKRDFNNRMRKKLEEFIINLKSRNIIFSNKDFRKIDVSMLTSNSLVYVDPPYLITCATYNENNMWNSNDEYDLLFFLDNLNDNNIRFAFSNVLRNKGKENYILLNWIAKNKSYKVIKLNYSYNNSNYHIKDRTKKTEEILIINY